jgi:hypothetical protein
MENRAILSAVGESSLYQEQLYRRSCVMSDDHTDETRLFVLKGVVQTPGGRSVAAEYINFTLSRLDGPKIADNLLLQRLIRYGIPTDLDCFNLVIAGTGINHPDYLFQFTGTIVEDINRTDAITSQPFDFLLTNSDKGKPAFRMIGYIWQSLVMSKENNSLQDCKPGTQDKQLKVVDCVRCRACNLAILPTLPQARLAQRFFASYLLEEFISISILHPSPHRHSPCIVNAAQ